MNRAKFLEVSLFIVSLQVAFPAPTSALSTLDPCAKDLKCRQVILPELTKSAAAPTSAGVATSTITTSGGTVRNAVAAVSVVGAGGAWYYWNESQNQKAQDLAQQRYYQAYCQEPSSNPLCGSFIGASFFYPNNNRFLDYQTYGWKFGEGQYYRAFKVEDCIWDYGGGQGPQNVGPTFKLQLSDGTWHPGCGGPGIDPSTLIIATFNAPPWKDWSDADRKSAVALLSDSDWKGLISSMPEGGQLNPGETIRAPQIVILGAETDDPNTPLIDERLPRVVSPSYTVPTLAPNPSPNPTPTPTPTPTPSPSPTPNPSPSPTPPPPLPTPTPTPTPPPPVPSPSPTPPPPSPSPTPNPSPSPLPKSTDDLTEAQKDTIRWLLGRKDPKTKVLEEYEVAKGKKRKNNTGCFYIELNRHLGNLSSDATSYATRVTGSPGDFIAIEPRGKAGYYDGLVKANGDAFRLKAQAIGSVAEAKYGYWWLNKFIVRNHPERDPQLVYDPTPKTTRERNIFTYMSNNQLPREISVAKACKLEYFMSFNDEQAFLSAKELFGDAPVYPKVILDWPVTVHHIPFP